MCIVTSSGFRIGKQKAMKTWPLPAEICLHGFSRFSGLHDQPELIKAEKFFLIKRPQGRHSSNRHTPAGPPPQLYIFQSVSL
jgi:hypothetical protein